MFRVLGRAVRSFWWIFLIAWPAFAVWLWYTSKTISDVATDDAATYLPPYAGSVVGRELLTRAFPADTFPSTVVIVVANRYERLSEEDLKYVERVTNALAAKDRPDLILGVLSVTNQPELNPIYTSKDGRATLIRVGLNTVWISRKVRPAVDWIRQLVGSPPKFLDVRVTGDAALGADYTQAANESLRRTTKAAIILVVLILLIIYRSPISPVVPLASIGMGFILANACIARAVETFGYAAPRMTEMFLVVVVFGAGTDYCLFLISRFKEHLLEGAGRGEAVERAVASVGSAIASSGATIIVGLASLYFAEFKEFGRIGPAVAFGLVIMLGIALTFAPSLMFVMGRLVFWPSGFRRAPDARENVVWVWLAQRISRHPWVTLLLMLMVFVPLAVIGGRVVPSYDIIGQLRSSMPSVAGFELLKRHFDQGEMLPVTLVMESDRDLRDPQRLDAQATLTRLLRQRPGVLGVRSAVEPYGRPQEFQRARFASQVGQMVQGAARGTAGVDELLEGVGAMRSGLEQAIRYVRDSQKKLVERSKGSTFLFVIPIPGPAEYRTASEGLAALAAGLDKISAGLDRMQKGLKTMREGLSTLEARLSPLADENGPYGYIAQHLFLLPKDFEANRELRKALDRYISRDGKLMRVSLIFKDPPHSLAASLCVQDLTSRLPDLMAGAGLQAKGTYLTGATATINDVRLLTQRDFYRVIVLVTVGVTIILFIQFRNVLALLYLMGTVLLSYAATMGIVLLVFHFGLGAQVDWKVRFLMFVIMVALGEDCNILIMSRITEERLRFGPYVGVERAIVRTGGIISSCGIIMAGTFSAMMASTLPVMVQLGFGIACGMLVDTFLVRPILLPAIILLLAPYKLVRTPRLRSAEPTASLHS